MFCKKKKTSGKINKKYMLLIKIEFIYALYFIYKDSHCVT